MLKPTLALLFAVAAVAPASAQSSGGGGLRGTDPNGGLHWHVAAPQGASWALDCRFRPVTIEGRMLNRYQRTGTGPQPGRLPTDHGRCTLKKTGGEGPVGIALVKNGQATADGTRDASRDAFIDVF